MHIATMTASLILAAGATAQVNFDSSTPFSTPSEPGGVVLADLNGDGNADMAVSTDAPDKITILHGDGAGGFVPGGTILTGGGSSPDALAAADMDGDGDQDLVVALKNINTVRVYINNGGAFAAGASATVGAEPRGLAVLDFDGDGDMDVATANRDGNSVSVLLSQGNGFSVATVGVGAEPRDIAGGDFNGDGSPDLAATNHDDRTISILTNNGAGSFGVSSTLFVNGQTRPEGITTADMDGDGDMDIVAATNGNAFNFTTVFINNGGAFAGPFDYATPGNETQNVAAADFDLDGDMDVLVSNDNTSNVIAMENSGAGALAAGQQIAVGATPERIALGDVDNDGATDAAVATRDSHQTWVLINGAEGGCVADCNGDGNLDVLDFVCFQGEWQAQTPAGDCDGNGVFNILDFVCFQSLFTAGCV